MRKKIIVLTICIVLSVALVTSYVCAALFSHDSLNASQMKEIIGGQWCGPYEECVNDYVCAFRCFSCGGGYYCESYTLWEPYCVNNCDAQATINQCLWLVDCDPYFSDECTDCRTTNYVQKKTCVW